MKFTTLFVLVAATSGLTVKSNDKVLRLRGGNSLVLSTEVVNKAAALYHGSFGVTLMSNPNFWASAAPMGLAYQDDAEGPVGEFFGRAFGTMRARIDRD